MSFCHLHCHSHYSLLDGLCSPADLALKAAQLGHKAIALTDHGTMSGAIEFYEACKKVNIKPIIGMEAYMAPESRLYKQSRKGDVVYGHLTLLAKNNIGYQNLMKLSTLAYTEGFYYKPRIDMELLKIYNEGIICLSGCMSSLACKRFIAQDSIGGEKIITQLYDIFNGDFYLEVMDTGVLEQILIIPYLNKISKIYDIPIVVTNDVHFIEKQDYLAHRALMCIGINKTLDEESKYDSSQNYLKTRGELVKKGFPEEWLSRTVLIADKCDIKIEFNRKFHIYKEKDAYSELKDICDEKIKAYPEEYKARYVYELEAIKKTGYSEYLMVVADFMHFARSVYIPVGSGRGSSAGSLVCYLLNITNIDPIKYSLLFERFININRVEAPDIDVDICQTRRGEVIEYLHKRYGDGKVAQITSFGKLKTKAVIRDVCRVLRISHDFSDKLCKAMQEPWEGTIKDVIADPKLYGMLERDIGEEQRDRLIALTTKLEGTLRHSSTHAAGVVISDVPLATVVPLYKRTSSSELLTQYDMYSVGKIGLLKFDILGLRTLTVINAACTLASIQQENIPLDDYNTYRNIQRGNTIGMFQYEGYGYTKFIRRMQPSTFNHLISLGALYRPGTLSSGMAEEYLNRMHGSHYSCKDDFLEETYGIMLYQEQIMKTVVKYAGFSMTEADILRKAIGKKDKILMGKMLAKIKDKELAGKIVTFARYGWNKAHAVSYALLSYYTAYLKTNYPVEFFCALANSEIRDAKKIGKILREAIKCKIVIEPPHINYSDIYFNIHHGKIYAGLLAIKGIGEKMCEYIMRARIMGLFKSEEDLRARVRPKHLNSRAFAILIKYDVFRDMKPKGEL